MSGRELVDHLLVDLLVKGAIAVAAVLLVVLLGVALWRRLS